MAAQIPSSVTILNSLKGFQALSLTEFTTSALSQIAAGSIVEVAGAFFNFPADETINASSWSAIATGSTAYIALTPSGTAGSQILTPSYTATAPEWRDDHQGWYASVGSVIRVIGSVYKVSSTAQSEKKILDILQKSLIDYKWQGIATTITSGSGNWVVPLNVYKLKVICVGGGGGGGSGATFFGSWLPGSAGASGGTTIFGAISSTGAKGGGGAPASDSLSGAGGASGVAGKHCGQHGTHRGGNGGGPGGGTGGANGSAGVKGVLGGGGGGYGGYTGNYTNGGGGGAGCSATLDTINVVDVTPLQVISYSVGAGGVGAGAGINDGGDGYIYIEY